VLIFEKTSHLKRCASNLTHLNPCVACCYFGKIFLLVFFLYQFFNGSSDLLVSIGEITAPGFSGEIFAILPLFLKEEVTSDDIHFPLSISKGEINWVQFLTLIVDDDLFNKPLFSLADGLLFK
jgi:hypothetical protein